MKKKYEKPTIEVEDIKSEDIMTCSCGRDFGQCPIDLGLGDGWEYDPKEDKHNNWLEGSIIDTWENSGCD